MTNNILRVPEPKNEPVLGYGPGSPEKKELKARLTELKQSQIEIPIIIGGKEYKTGDLGECRCPHEHQHVLVSSVDSA